MRRQDRGSIPFSDYLDAKFALDERSLNAEVRALLGLRLRGQPRLSCLDVGSGTGAMVRRLLRTSMIPEMVITVLDCDRHMLETARRRISSALQQMRMSVDENGSAVRGDSIGRSVVIDFVGCRLSEFSSPAFRYDLITAHSFMDLVPIAPTLRRFAQWLAPEGLLYATLNYDGVTAVYPPFRDRAFERALLAAYDASMEDRRVDGEATGGAHAGSRLLDALFDLGWNVLAYGSSDWGLAPVSGHYLDRDKVCVQALLDFIRGEGDRRNLDPDALSRWSADRAEQVEAERLGLVVHQLDMLAIKPSIR